MHEKDHKLSWLSYRMNTGIEDRNYSGNVPLTAGSFKELFFFRGVSLELTFDTLDINGKRLYCFREFGHQISLDDMC